MYIVFLKAILLSLSHNGPKIMKIFFRRPEFNADIPSDSADDHLPIGIFNFISWKFRWIMTMTMTTTTTMVRMTMNM